MRHFSSYRHLAISNARPAPTAAQVEAIEALLGAPLPQSFLGFLAVANGGYIEYIIDVPIGDSTTEPLSFCGIFSAEGGDFCDETFIGEIRAAREYAKVPEGVLPFARDGGGSMAYLDLTSEGKDRVVAFVMGLPEWTGLRTESAFIELAATFDEYVSKLRLDRGAILDHLEHDATELEHIAAIEESLDIGMPQWREDSEIVEAVRAARESLTNVSR